MLDDHHRPGAVQGSPHHRVTRSNPERGLIHALAENRTGSSAPQKKVQSMRANPIHTADSRQKEIPASGYSRPYMPVQRPIPGKDSGVRFPPNRAVVRYINPTAGQTGQSNCGMLSSGGVITKPSDRLETDSRDRGGAHHPQSTLRIGCQSKDLVIGKPVSGIDLFAHAASAIEQHDSTPQGRQRHAASRQRLNRRQPKGANRRGGLWLNRGQVTVFNCDKSSRGRHSPN